MFGFGITANLITAPIRLLVPDAIFPAALTPKRQLESSQPEKRKSKNRKAKSGKPETSEFETRPAESRKLESNKAETRLPVDQIPVRQHPVNCKLVVRADDAAATALAAQDQKRRTLAQAYAKGRELVGMIASEATSKSPPADSDIDWKLGSQGLDLLLNASRESFGGPKTDFERLAYISGAQYLLWGLPFNLNREEATLLRHAMPQRWKSQPLPVPTPTPGSDGGKGGKGGKGDNRTWTLSAALLLLGWACAAAAWLWPVIAGYAPSMAQAERKEHYVEGVLWAVAGLMEVTRGVLRWIGEPCHLVRLAVEWMISRPKEKVEKMEEKVEEEEKAKEEEKHRYGNRGYPGW